MKSVGLLLIGSALASTTLDPPFLPALTDRPALVSPAPGPYDSGSVSHIAEWTATGERIQAIREDIDIHDASSDYTVDQYYSDTERFGTRTIRLTTEIAKTFDSVIFEARSEEGETLIAKYGTDCRARYHGSGRDVLLEEFVLLSALNETRVTPEVYYLSPPWEIQVPLPPKIRSRLVTESLDTCLYLKASGRFFVMEAAGQTVEDYLTWLRRGSVRDRSYLKTVMRIGIRTLDLIETLHSRGFYHGDIHGRNILFRQRKLNEEYVPDEDDLVLIDLGRARYFVPEMSEDSRIVNGVSGNAVLQSVWELNGMRSGRRDDIYRLVELLAVHLSDGRIENSIARTVSIWISEYAAQRKGRKPGMTVEAEVCQFFKNSTAFFAPDPFVGSGCCNRMGLSPRELSQVRGKLDEAMRRIKQIPHPDAQPDYESLRTTLIDVYSIAASWR